MSGSSRVAKTLTAMSMQAMTTRLRRSVARLLSPKRLVATVAALIFVSLYLFNGILVILTRKPADPSEITVWLGGAMAVYAMFHFVRVAWQEPEPRLGMSLTESLWIGRAPISNRTLIVYRLASMLPSVFVKSTLIAMVLYCDVSSPIRLLIALFISIFVLEVIRMIADRLASSLSVGGRIGLRTAMTAIAIAVAVQLLARMVDAAAGSVHPLALVKAFSVASGETAACETLQWLALPWWATTHFATAASWNLATVTFAIVSMGTAALSVVSLIAVDRWASWHHEWVEGARLVDFKRGILGSPFGSRRLTQPRRSLRRLPKWTGVGPLLARQWVGVVRFRGTIFVSLAVPAALSLAPLMTSHEAGLLHVAAWLAVSTFLLAPPALKIDFRRDIDRMWLLKSLPITPLAMTIGQILLPTLITIAFQWIVIAIACAFAAPNFATIALVVGGLSGLALFSFATENALFLVFPHRIKQEGFAMMVRTKLVFLGKGLVLGLFAGAFLVWVNLCSRFDWSLSVLVCGCIVASWGLAAIATSLAARSWRRFDIRLDLPLGH